MVLILSYSRNWLRLKINKEDMKAIKISLVVVGVLLMTGLLVPQLIRGFFWLLLQGMKNPLEATIILSTLLTFYIIGIRTKF